MARPRAQIYGMERWHVCYVCAGEHRVHGRGQRRKFGSGFILYQSENYEPIPPTGNGPGSPQNFMSYQFLGNEGGQNVVTMITGGTRAYFKIYETVALNGAGVRAGGPAVYNLCDNLKVSENGLLCNDSDANLAAAGVTTPVLVGIVSSTPSSVNGNRLCIDTKW